MKKSNQEVSVLHIKFPFHTVLIIGGQYLKLIGTSVTFGPITKSEIVNNIISMANLSVQWNLMNVEQRPQRLVRQYLTRVQH